MPSANLFSSIQLPDAGMGGAGGGAASRGGTAMDDSGDSSGGGGPGGGGGKKSAEQRAAAVQEKNRRAQKRFRERQVGQRGRDQAGAAAGPGFPHFKCTCCPSRS